MDDGAIIGGGGIVAVITAIGTFIVGIRHGRAEFITAVHKAADQVIGRLENEITRVTAAHHDCEERLKEHKHEADEKFAAMRAEIDALMSGEVPTYKIIRRP